MTTLARPKDAVTPGSDVNSSQEEDALSAAPLVRSQLEGELWRQAAAEIDWKPPPNLHLNTSDTLGLLDSLYWEAHERMIQEENNRRKWRLRGGKEISFRGIWSKVLEWVKKFQTIGDIAVQADAGYASLPWALVRLILTAAVSENETRGAMLEGMEFVSRLITQYRAIEQMYALEYSRLAASLRHSLVSLYTSVLRYLVYHVKFLDQNGFKRSMKGLNPNAIAEIKTLLRRIEDNKTRADSDASHISNELTRKGIDIMQQGQMYLISQQQRMVDSQRDFIEGELNIRSRQNIMQQQAEDQMHCLQSVLEEWQKGSREMQGQVSDIYTSTVETPNLRRIMDWLSTIRHDIHHAAVQKDILHSSGKWLLENPEFRDWRESARSSVLWMHGYLGTGKTRLISIVTEDVRTTLRDSFGFGRLAYFYCSRNEAGADNGKMASSRAEPLEVLRSLVKQLAEARGGGGLEAVVTDKYSQLKGADTEEPRRLNMKECVDLIILLSKDSPTSIMVDGLDECRHVAVRDLIQSFEEIVTSSARQVKVFLSTRYVSAIVDCLKQYGYPALEVTADKNSRDIARFIDVELEKRIENRSLLHGNVSAGLRSEIQETLGQRAGSMFWYASLQLNLLCDPTAEQDETGIRQKLRESPTTLKEAYVQILQEIEDPKNSLRSRTVAHCTMNWLLCAQEALSCGAFLEAIGDETVDRDFVIRVCRSLVIEDKENDVFEFAHLSVREHLERTQEYMTTNQHLVAAERCLRMVETSFLSSAMNHDTTPSKEEFRRYAFLFWALHYQNTDFSKTDERKEKLRTKLKSLLIRGSGVSPTFKQWISQVKDMHTGLHENMSLSRKLKSLQASPDTALFTACVFGFPDLITQFRRTKGFDFDQCNVQGQTALCLAVENNQLETVKNLLADLPKPHSPPLNASQVNHWALIQYEEFRQGSPSSVFTYASALQAAAAHGLEAMARFLLEQGAKIDLVAGYYGSALQAAAFEGHDSLVRIFLEEYEAEPNSQGGFHGNALQAAAISGNANSVALLIGHGALVSAPGGHYDSALMAAVCSNNIEILELLLEQKADVNVNSILYGTPLQKAADMNSKELLERLIAEGAEINAQDTNDGSHSQAGAGSALAAAAWGGHSKVVSILLEHGAQADTTPRGTAFHILHQAASRGMLDLVKYCLDGKGCNIDMKTTGGQTYSTFQENMTPLSFACAEGHEKTVAYLLERGASVEFEGDAVTTLSLAARRSHPQIIKKLIEYSRAQKGPEETQCFIDRCCPEVERSALHEAALGGSLEVVDALLEARAKYCSDASGLTPLHLAAIDHRIDLILLLIEKYQREEIVGDFSIDARDNDGKTPLLYAIESGNPSIISKLLQSGAKPDVCDNLNNSSLHYAVALNQKAIAHLILPALHQDTLATFLDKRNCRNNTALIEAVQMRYFEMIEVLLAYGAKWHENEGRELDLYSAARRDKALVQEYIKAFECSDQLSCFLNSRNKYGATPLFAAAMFDQPNIIQILLDSGTDLYTLDGHGRTALYWATEAGNTESVRVLLDFAEKYADEKQPFIDHRNLGTMPALHLAVMHRRLASVQLLLDHDAGFMSCGIRNETALTLAAQDERKLGYQDCVPIANLILKKAKEKKRIGELVNSYNSERATGLWQACHHNLPEMVSLLLDHGAHYFISTKYDVTPLHIACWLNQQNAAKVLLEHSSQDRDEVRFRAFINQVDHWGRTALNAAACNGNSELVALLLENYHADYSISCPSGDVPEPLFTPLHYAATRGYDKMVNIVLCYIARDKDQVRAKAFLDAKHGSDRRDTALIAAAGRRSVATVRALLEAGTDYSLRNDRNATALIAGVCSGALSTVKALLDFVAAEPDRLKAEAFLNAKNNLGKTALIDGAERDHSTIVKALLETPDLDHTLQDKSGFTALHWCAFKDNRGSAMAILEFASQDKADHGRRFEDFLNVRARSNGHSALFDAAANGHFELTKLLLDDYHAAYDTYDSNGASPLHFAVRQNHMPIADVYLAGACVSKDKDGGRFNAFVNKRDEEGKTALELAIENNNGRFMELLKKHLSVNIVVESSF